MPDPIFAHPRLAAAYDRVHADRNDLDPYLAIAEELGARSVLDVGCGTGTLACLLAARGLKVTGVDPAPASLDVARKKRHAPGVEWVPGTVANLPPLTVDLALMTGNTAQVFLTNEEWTGVLEGVRGALRPRGVLVFETRDPERRGWEDWDTRLDPSRVQGEGNEVIEHWTQLLEVAPPLVSFRETFRFDSDGAVLTSESTLRFRGEDEIRRSLLASGFSVADVRDAPDRPGRELVVLANRVR